MCSCASSCGCAAEQLTPLVPGPQGPQGIAGSDGSPGISAYQVAVNNGFVGTESQWLASLQGETGPEGPEGTDGVDGLSAYEVAVENGFVGNEAAWLASLQGTAGSNGSPGAAGPQGEPGDAGPRGDYGGNTLSFQFNNKDEADPFDPGEISFNGETDAPSVTNIITSYFDVNGNNASAWLLDPDSYPSSRMGYFRLFAPGDSTTYAIYKITSVTDDASGEKINFTVVNLVATSSPVFTNGDEVALSYQASFNINDYDTGWQTLYTYASGVTEYGLYPLTNNSRTPQFRIVGRRVELRGDFIVPLANSGSLVADAATYYSVASKNVQFTGTGLTDNADGIIVTAPLMKDSILYPQSSMIKNTVFIMRQIASKNNGRGLILGSFVNLSISSAGTLSVSSVFNVENPASPLPTTEVKHVLLRDMISVVNEDDFNLDYTSYRTSMNGSLALNTNFTQGTETYPFNFDGTRWDNLGGFVIPLDGMSYLINQATQLETIHDLF